MGVSTAEGGAERIEKEKGKKNKRRRGGGKSKARIGEIEDQKTGKKSTCRRRRKEDAEGEGRQTDDGITEAG